jgi:hypothetical protein
MASLVDTNEVVVDVEQRQRVAVRLNALGECVGQPRITAATSHQVMPLDVARLNVLWIGATLYAAADSTNETSSSTNA